jgi:hypothetical protein
VCFCLFLHSPKVAFLREVYASTSALQIVFAR